MLHTTKAKNRSDQTWDGTHENTRTYSEEKKLKVKFIAAKS